MAIERSVRINIQTRDAQRNLQSLDRSLNATDRSSSTLSSSITGLVAAIGGTSAVVQASREFIEFEQAIAGVAAVSRASESQLASLSDQARLLGATTIFGAQQAADAQRFLAQAGLEVNEVLSATPGILSLAQSGQLDLAEAADIATNVMSGLRLEVSDLNRVNDVLAETAASSNTNVRQLGEALSFSAPLAAAAGISLEEAAAAIGVISDNGIQASRAGTGLVGVIRQLSNATPEAERALRGYGISVSDVNVSTVGLGQALGVLREANISVSDAFQIFGTEAGAAAQILIENSARTEDFAESLRNAEGAADQASEVLSDTLGATLRGLQSALSEAAIQAGDSGLAGALRETVVVATGVVQSYNGLLSVYAESNDLTEQQVSSIETLNSVIGVSATLIAGRLAGSLAQSAAARARSIELQTAESAAYRENAVVVARADAQRAASNRAVTEADLRRAQTNQQVASTEVSRLRAVEQGLVAERLAEQSRLAAQISDRGRQLSLTRLAEIERSRASILGQITAAENTLTAATVRTTAALNANNLAGDAAIASNANLARSITATSTVAVAAGAAMRGLSSAVTLLGGPVGIALIAATALLTFSSSQETAEDTTIRLREETDRLRTSLGALSEDQINRNIAQTTATIVGLREARQGLFEEASDLGLLPENILVEVDGVNTSLRDLNEQIGTLETRNELSRAQLDQLNESLSQTNNTVRPLAGNVNGLSEEFQTATFTIGRLTTNTEIAADRLLRLNEQLNPGQSEARQYSAFIQELTERLNPAGVALQSLREQVEFTNTAYNQGVITYSQYREELDRLDAQILDVELAHTRNNQATDESSDSAERATQSQSALSQALVVAGQSAEASSRQLDTATEATRRLVEETQRLSTTTSSISSSASFSDLDSDSQAAFRARARGQLNQSSFGGTPSAAAIEQLATQLFIEATGGSRGRFANGGQFMVGGSGGTDSQRVTFDASPDERVTIETPAQQRQSRGVVVQNLTIQAQDRSIEEVFIELQQLQLQSGVMLEQTRGTIS